MTQVPEPATDVLAEPPLPLAPIPREWTKGDGSFSLLPDSRIVAGDEHQDGDAQTFAADLRQLTGRALPVVVGSQPRAGDIVLRFGDDAPEDHEGYVLTIGDTVRLTARGGTGLSRGTQTVEQLFAAGPRIPRGTVRDWPRFAERGVMLDVGRKYYEPASIEQLIRTAAWYKLNTVHLHLTEWNAFRLDSPKFPGLAAAQSYTREDIARFEQVAATYHVAIIPEIDLPSHATQITAYWPDTVWPCAAMNDERGHNFTVDVTNPATLDVVRRLLEEFLPWFEGDRFHIGADEYPYQSTQERCPALVDYAERNGYANTSDVIVGFINFMNSIVRAHGKRSQAWGWWDAAGSPTVKPDRDIVVEAYGDNEFAGGAAGERYLLNEGYDVIYADGNQLYVTPGLDLLPDNAALYTNWPTVDHPRLCGYMMGRWSDEREHEPEAYHDWFAHRAQQVVADRAWGGPRLTTHLEFETLVDRIGPPPGVAGQIASTANARRITGTPYPVDGSYVGIDAGSPVRVTKVRVLPRSAAPADLQGLVGGRLQGKADPDQGWVDLATIPWPPPGHDWVQLPVHDAGEYRWLRYLGRTGDAANSPEVEFYTATR